MKSKITLAVAAAVIMVSGSASAAERFVDVGFADQSIEIGNDTMDSRSITLEAGVKFNPYFSLSAWTGFNGDKEVLRTQTDTYVNHLGGDEYSDVQTETYESTFEMTQQYGVNATFYVPIKQNVELFVSAGYGWYKWEGEIYTSFDDSKPSANPLESFNAGASACEVTGIEESCGVNVGSIVSGDTIETPMGSAGLIWGISKTTSMVAGYSKSFKDEIDVSSYSVELRFRF